MSNAPGVAHIMTTRRDTHFMCGETTVEYFERLIGPAFRRKRAELGLVGERGGLLADAFGGNNKGDLTRVRERFARKFNIQLLAAGLYTPRARVGIHMHTST